PSLETELFPLAALEAYSRLNLGKDLLPQDPAYITPERGGDQGYYATGIEDKISNVVSALQDFPASKRAVITLAVAQAQHQQDDLRNCMREVQFRLLQVPGQSPYLDVTVTRRAQALAILPKNLHFVRELAHQVCSRLGSIEGALFYHAVTLFRERGD